MAVINRSPSSGGGVTRAIFISHWSPLMLPHRRLVGTTPSQPTSSSIYRSPDSFTCLCATGVRVLRRCIPAVSLNAVPLLNSDPQPIAYDVS